MNLYITMLQVAKIFINRNLSQCHTAITYIDTFTREIREFLSMILDKKVRKSKTL